MRNRTAGSSLKAAMAARRRSRGTAVDEDDALLVACSSTNAIREILKRVTRFRENDDLAVHVVGRIVDEWIIQNVIELPPLGIFAGSSQSAG
jgi:hypothetical protein